MKKLIDYIQFFCEAKSIDIVSVARKENQPYNKSYGNCIILAGGPASGKSYNVGRSFTIDGYKTYDVDKYKEFFLNGLEKGKKSIVNVAKKREMPSKKSDYKMENPDDVSKLHFAVKDLKWKEIQRNNLDKSLSTTKFLPNIVFDITGKEESDISELAEMAKSHGYLVTFVWVVCSRQRAIFRNHYRARHVSDKIFHTIHNEVARAVPRMLINEDITKNIDQAWILFSSGVALQKWDESQVAFNIKKNADGIFEMSDSLRKHVSEVVGELELNPENLKTYKTTEEIFGPNSEYGFTDDTSNKKAGELKCDKTLLKDE